MPVGQQPFRHVRWVTRPTDTVPRCGDDPASSAMQGATHLLRVPALPGRRVELASRPPNQHRPDAPQLPYARRDSSTRNPLALASRVVG